MGAGIGRSRPARLGTRLGLIAAGVLAALLLAVVVPFALEVRLSHQCDKLGGQLDRTTEDVEPLVVARGVYLCHGPDGRLLDKW